MLNWQERSFCSDALGVYGRRFASSDLSDQKEGSQADKHNGKGKKTLRSNHGDVITYTPRDRISTFEPQIVDKRQRILVFNYFFLTKIYILVVPKQYPFSTHCYFLVRFYRMFY
ncbi:transposase [Galbibacter orientalis]|uniref:transposase n=1 Tax=Galbibacter orientalis TaxID=453852 RepID=UPI003B52C519